MKTRKKSLVRQWKGATWWEWWWWEQEENNVRVCKPHCSHKWMSVYYFNYVTMSSNNIDPAVVTTLVRMTTIDNTSVVDIHSLSSEWNTYLVRFTPANPGPVVSAYIHHSSLSLMCNCRNLYFVFETAQRLPRANLAPQPTSRSLILPKCEYCVWTTSSR